MSRLPCILAASCLALTWAHSVEMSTGSTAPTGLKPPERLPRPEVAAASDVWEKQARKMQVPEGFTLGLFAAEPLLANPVSFTIDEKGVMYVAESYRYRTSTLDIRHYMFMLEDDLACRTTDDRIASIKKNFPKDWEKLGVETEVVRRVEDTDGDGKADRTSVYADGMNSLLDGINSGVLAHDGKVWCANIPNLWAFSGLTKDGAAEKREILSSGYGVRFSFTGHDLHGLTLAPDGRLYFSLGDRGAHVVTREGKTIALPDEGGVFRCERDGSQLELVCRGLRNPQELAFDNHGNLFTGDNDGDMGDRERWHYLVPGGDYGWRVGWQHHPIGKEANPWMTEHLWEPRKTETPAWVLSPVVLLPDGPSGVVHYPGTGMPAEYANRFFVCSFKGSSARSVIASLSVQESGAGFAVEKEPATFLGSVQATDVAFGPDSRMYFTEWGEGWESTKAGRIYSLSHNSARFQQAAQIAEVKKLLGEGFRQRGVAELAKLLAHADQRIRLNAQWALAEKAVAAEAIEALKNVALHGADGAEKKLSRLHAIWGLGQAARQYARSHPDEKASGSGEFETALLRDADAEVRAQFLRAVGEVPAPLALATARAISAKLADPAPRVRFQAALALANRAETLPAGVVGAFLRSQLAGDEFLRHAGVMLLASPAGQPALEAVAQDESSDVRLVALLALRRLEKPEAAQFLDDKDPLLVREAARAINDAGIADALPALARLIENPRGDDMQILRVLNATFRTGNAAALTAFAADPTNSERLRLEALSLLATFPKPFARDRVAGIYRLLPERSAEPAITALAAAFPKLLDANSADIGIAAISAAQTFGMKATSPALFDLMGRPETSPKLRRAALETLAAFDEPKLAEAIKLALADRDPALRVGASSILGKLDPDEAARQLAAAFADAAVAEKKAVLTALAGLKSDAADQALAGFLDELAAAKIPAEVQLELLEAAAKRTAPEVKAKLAAYHANLPKGDPLAAFAPTLAGGDAVEGERLFKEHAIAACLRCHIVNGAGGEAGPVLTSIASKKDRKYLLESIVAPNAQIADGFQMVIVTKTNGEVLAGVLKSDTGATLTLLTPEPGAPPLSIAKSDIKSRENAPSGMLPNLGELLTKREIRDLVEYVASLKAP